VPEVFVNGMVSNSILSIGSMMAKKCRPQNILREKESGLTILTWIKFSMNILVGQT
jgi:hypothetical protein